MPFLKKIWIKHSKQFPVKGDLISICPSGLFKCPFLKERCTFIEVKSLFLRGNWFNSFILNKQEVLHQKALQLNFCDIFFILIFNELYLSPLMILNHAKLGHAVTFMKNLISIINFNFSTKNFKNAFLSSSLQKLEELVVNQLICQYMPRYANIHFSIQFMTLKWKSQKGSKNRNFP